MLFISIINIIIAVALSPVKLTSILKNRIIYILFILIGVLSFTFLYAQSIGSGVGIYSGLFQVTFLSQSIETFIYFMAALILVPWAYNTSFSKYTRTRLATSINKVNYKLTKRPLVQLHTRSFHSSSILRMDRASADAPDLNGEARDLNNFNIDNLTPLDPNFAEESLQLFVHEMASLAVVENATNTEAAENNETTDNISKVIETLEKEGDCFKDTFPHFNPTESLINKLSNFNNVTPEKIQEFFSNTSIPSVFNKDVYIQLWKDLRNTQVIEDMKAEQLILFKKVAALENDNHLNALLRQTLIKSGQAYNATLDFIQQNPQAFKYILYTGASISPTWLYMKLLNTYARFHVEGGPTNHFSFKDSARLTLKRDKVWFAANRFAIPVVMCSIVLANQKLQSWPDKLFTPFVPEEAITTSILFLGLSPKKVKYALVPFVSIIAALLLPPLFKSISPSLYQYLAIYGISIVKYFLLCWFILWLLGYILTLYIFKYYLSKELTGASIPPIPNYLPSFLKNWLSDIKDDTTADDKIWIKKSYTRPVLTHSVITVLYILLILIF